jgi:tetratricopeptide (TPR) repeat protein
VVSPEFEREVMRTDALESAIKAARDCHTKANWDEFYLNFADTLSNKANAKLVSTVFKKLESDPQSLFYGPQIWGALLQGAISCWDIETGVAAANFCRKLTTPVVSIPAAQALLDGGKPTASRDLAQRALRSENTSDLERIQLQLIVGSSFAEEGKTDHAVRTLGKASALIKAKEMPLRARADFSVKIGRIHYFIGRYQDAAVAFEEAAPFLVALEDWDGAARALFNAGACIQNGGTENSVQATAFVERSRKISVEQNLSGPLSHCEAFYGVEAYNKGSYMAAREHFRRALAALPANDTSYRRLHVVSFLSFTYFAMGKFALGIKFGRQTLDLAAEDSSGRFISRYQSLEAEILWEEGKIGESLEVSRASVHLLALHGVRNLEELSTVTRYQIHLAISGETSVEKFKIEPSLQLNLATWIEYLYSNALLKCSYEYFTESMADLTHCLRLAKECGSLNYEALILLAIVRLNLQKHDLVAAQEWLPSLEVAVARLGDSPIRAKLQIVYSSMSYQSGDFEKAIKCLTVIDKMSAVSWVDRFVTQACLATARGESPRLQYKWQENLVSRFVRGYFAPTIKFDTSKLGVSPGGRITSFIVSNHYVVSLEKHPAMADLLVYLSERMPEGASLADIQTNVWKESLNAQGWQQKIRNAVMRVRDLFPYTMAPIVIHNESLRFFCEAIRILQDEDNTTEASTEGRVQKMLNVGPLSSLQVAEKMEVSLATAKRLLKKMTDGGQIKIEKMGRSVVYHGSVSQL